MKKLILSIALVAMTVAASAGLTVKEAAGWLESAYMEFNGLDTTAYSKYNAYVSSNGGSAWTQLDSMLIRSYGTYGRVDAVGLVAGSDYKLKVVPCNTQGVEVAADAVVSSVLTVVNYNREGFAHTGNYATTGVGAYNNDGSLKAGAKVFYVTAATAKTLSTSVQTSDKGAMTPCTGMQAIIDAYQKGYDKTPIAFRIIGLLRPADMDALSSSEEGLQVKGRAADSELNMTFEGIGNDAMLRFGFLVRNAASVEIRNLGIATTIDDDVSLDTDNDHVWIHNLDVYYGPNKGGDQKKGDGAIDVKGNSKHVTISYNHFWDTGKSTMCGMHQDNAANYITYHHNWFDHSDSRHARIRTMSVHMYNNYYDCIAKYGVGATEGSSVFMEANYFNNCSKPMLISMQGTDTKMGTDTKDAPTFSGEDGGIIKSFGNTYSGSKTLVTYQQNQTHFDCWEATNRNDQVPNTVTTLQGGHTYDNFDTNTSLMYTYSPDAAADVPADVTGIYGAGRIQHGDFQWTFTAADQTSSEVNDALRTAIDNYATKLVSIIGVTGGMDPNPTPDPDPVPGEGGYELYWDNEANAWSTTFYAVSGNTTKKTQTITLLDGTEVEVAYGLKMESATSVKFNAPSACILKLIFQNDQTGNIKIDGTKYTSTDNILTRSIAAGEHEITKGDSRNVYYIALDGVSPQGLTSPVSSSRGEIRLVDGKILILRGERVFTIDGRRVK